MPSPSATLRDPGRAPLPQQGAGATSQQGGAAQQGGKTEREAEYQQQLAAQQQEEDGEESTGISASQMRQTLAVIIKEHRRRMKILREDIEAEIKGTQNALATYMEGAFSVSADVAKLGTFGISNIISYPIMIIIGIFKVWRYASIRYSPERAAKRITKLKAREVQRLIWRALFAWLPAAQTIMQAVEVYFKERHTEQLKKLQHACDKQEAYMKNDVERGGRPLPRRFQLALKHFRDLKGLESRFDML